MFIKRMLSLFLGLTLSFGSFAGMTGASSPKDYVAFQVGFANSHVGEQQNISIDGMLGNRYLMARHSDNGAVFGFSYFTELPGSTSIDMGLSAYAFSRLTTRGGVNQEFFFNQLSYQYKTAFYPVYANIKANMQPDDANYSFTMDLGIGADWILTDAYQEYSLDGGQTIPAQTFKGKTSVKATAMLGLGMRFKPQNYLSAVEIGYRFFDLGSGRLQSNNTQVLNELSTGRNFAHSIVLSLIV